MKENFGHYKREEKERNLRFIEENKLGSQVNSLSETGWSFPPF